MAGRKRKSLTGKKEANKKKMKVQKRRSDPEQHAQEQQADTSRRKEARADSQVRAVEQDRDTSRRREVRKDSQVRSAEQDKNTLCKRRNKIHDWDEAVAQYEKSIQDGPVHRCRSCDRIFFEKQIHLRNRKQLNDAGWTNELITELVVADHVEDNDFLFCSTCNSYLTKSRKKHQPGTELPPKKFPRFNANKSNLKFPDVPEVIAQLSPLEERCVALRIPFMKIQALGCDRQYGIKSGVVNVPVDVRRTIKAIPAAPDDSGVIEVSLMRAMKYKGYYMKERIRPGIVWKVAELLSNTPLYLNEGIVLDRNWEQQQAQASIQMQTTEQQPIQSTVQPAIQLNEDEEMEVENVLADVNAMDFDDDEDAPGPDPDAVEQNEGYIEEETMLDSAEGIAFAPGEGQTPIPMFLDKYCKEMSWPTIWGGNLCPETPEGIKLSESDKSNHEILRYDRRACKPAYLLFLHKVETVRQLKNATSIALRKSAQTNSINAAQVLDRQFVDNAVRKDNAYRFMSTIVGSPAYWEDKKKKVLAMVRQLGIFTLFITLTAAETKWPDLIKILKKTLDKEDITIHQAQELPFEEVSRLIRNDPVTCARYFDHRFKELKRTWTHCNDGPFGNYKIVDMFYRIEFQHRGSPHVHMVIWLENAPKFECDNQQSEEAVVEFIDSIITTNSEDTDVQDQIGKQFHKCSHTCFRDEQKKCRFKAPFRPMDRTRILMPLEKAEEAELETDVVKKIREFNQQLDNELNNNSGNIESFEALLEKMQVDLDFYILATRKTHNHPKIFLKRAPKDCRINGYNKKILLLMRSNMDIQFVLDAYACIGYIVDYINKSARGLSRLLRMCIEDCQRGNKSISEQMKALSHILYNSTEVSAQEAAWCRLRLAMCSTSVAVEFIHSGPPELRQRILKSTGELQKLPPDSTDIYKQGALDRYALRSDDQEQLCLAEFVAKYRFCSKNGRSTEEIEEEANEFNEIEQFGNLEDDEELDPQENPEEHAGPRRNKLQSYPLKDGSGEMKEKRRMSVIRYCRFSFAKDPNSYFREMALLFLPWRDETVDIEEKNWEELYTSNDETIKINFRKFNDSEIDFDLIAKEIEENRAAEELEAQENENNDGNNQGFVNVYDFDENVIQPNAAVEMGLQGGGIDTPQKYSIPSIYEKEKYFELMDSLNEEQRDMVMDINALVKNNQIPFYYFLTGGAGTGKSQTIKAIYQSVIRQYRANPSEVASPEILIVSFTGMAAHNVDGMTAHSAFHLTAGKNDKITKLSPSMKNTLRTNLLNLKLLIIDEISMLSSKLLDQISYRLKEIFEKQQEFGGISVIVVGDFNQLPPVGGRLAFQTKDTTSTAILAGNPQWALFKIFRLNKIMRQKDDQVFAEALNRLAVGKCTPEDIVMWNSRVFKETDLPEQALKATRLFEQHKYIDEYNKIIVEEKKIGAAYNIMSKAEDRLIGTLSTTQKNQALNAISKLRAHEAQGLAAELELVENVRYMITVNIDVQDGLYNGALGTLKRIDLERIPGQQHTKSAAVWIEFDCASIGAEARKQKRPFMLANKIPENWTPINRIHKQFNVLAKGTVQVNRHQYPLVVAESRTIHKSQGLTQDTAVIDAKGNRLTRQKAYTAISRSRTLNGVFIMTKFEAPHPPPPNDPVVCELERMEKDCQIVPKFQELRLRSNEYLKITSHNVQSINSHLKSIVCDSTYTSSDILLFQETWLKTDVSHDIETFAEISRNKLTTANGKGTIIYAKNNSNITIIELNAVEEKSATGHCEITSFIVNGTLLVINVYKNPNCTRETFQKAMEEYKTLIETYDNVLATGDYNEDVKNGSGFNRFMYETYALKLMSPEEPTTFKGTCIDGVFGKLKDFEFNSKIYFSYFSHHYPIVMKLFKKC